MKRILQITSSLRPYGTETFIMNVFRNIDRRRFMFDFLVETDTHEGFYDEIKGMGGRVFHLPPRREGLFASRKGLDSFFREHAWEFSAVHYNGMSLSSVGALEFAAKHGIRKRIAHIHGSSCSEFHNRILHKLNRLRIGKLATHLLACSPEALEWGCGRVDETGNSRIIVNGIETGLFRFKASMRSIKRVELGLGNELAIGHLGYFLPVKNHSFLLDTFKEICCRGVNAKLLLAGDGPLMGQTIRMVREMGIGDKVAFLGHRRDVPDLLNAFDVLLLPSLHEGFPLSVLESLSNGLPVVSSEAVSRMLPRSDRFVSIPLEAGARTFADAVLSYRELNREEWDFGTYYRRFDIRETVCQLENIYNE